MEVKFPIVESSKERFACTICQEAASSKRNIRRHCRDAHRVSAKEFEYVPVGSARASQVGSARSTKVREPPGRGQRRERPDADPLFHMFVHTVALIDHCLAVCYAMQASLAAAIEKCREHGLIGGADEEVGRHGYHCGHSEHDSHRIPPTFMSLDRPPREPSRLSSY
jgi:hypothetical protein